MIVSREEFETKEGEFTLTVPASAMTDSTLFEKWFIKNYMILFKRLPELTKNIGTACDSEKLENIKHYYEIISKVVSLVLYQRDESSLISEKTRLSEVVMMRKIVCYIMGRKMGFPLVAVGRMIGKDHSTVIYHARCVENYLSVDRKFRAKFSEIESDLKRIGLMW